MTDPIEKLQDRVNDMAQGLSVAENEQRHLSEDTGRRFKNVDDKIEIIEAQIIEINENNIELQASGKAFIKTIAVLFTCIATLGGLALKWMSMQIP